MAKQNIALVTKIVIAMQCGQLPRRTTQIDIEHWIKEHAILKSDGLPYSDDTIKQVLPARCIGGSGTKRKFFEAIKDSQRNITYKLLDRYFPAHPEPNSI